MNNFLSKMFTRNNTTDNTKDTDLFTRISVHHNKNVRKVSQSTTVHLRGTKKQALVEILRKGIPMTAREMANVTGFSLLSYVAPILAQSFASHRTNEANVFKKVGKRKCMYSGRIATLYTTK